jgi:hypothetical protein
MPSLERSTERAEFGIAKHKRDGRQIVLGTLNMALGHGLAHGQYELIIGHVAVT